MTTERSDQRGTLDRSLDDLLAPLAGSVLQRPGGPRRGMSGGAGRRGGTAGSVAVIGVGLGVVLGLAVSVLYAVMPGSKGDGGASAARPGSGAAAAGQVGQRPGQPAGAGKPAAGAAAVGLPTITGTFTLWSTKPQKNACADHPQLPDIAAAAPVLVSDEGGTVLARSALTAGRMEGTHRGCVFSFSVAGVPRAEGYQVKVGRQSALTYPAADLVEAGWQVQLNLGLPDPPAGNG
jgi:hypothetical protein